MGFQTGLQEGVGFLEAWSEAVFTCSAPCPQPVPEDQPWSSTKAIYSPPPSPSPGLSALSKKIDSKSHPKATEFSGRGAPRDLHSYLKLPWVAFSFFSCATGQVGSQFPDQGSNSGLGSECKES